jgi:hypothetical protein
LLEIDFV